MREKKGRERKVQERESARFNFAETQRRQLAADGGKQHRHGW